MRSWISLSVALTWSMGLSGSVQAQIIIADHPCQTCLQPVIQCQCLRTRPVVQTHLREERITTYKDVVETRYREECVVEQKPVTTIEDRVETVWVPQQVTKKVARTVLVPQAKARTVPYQVMQRIPETTTRLVPYQTVHHVTEAVPMALVPAAPILSQTWITPAPMGAPLINPTGPQSASMTPHRAPPLAPAAKNSGNWQTIPPRSASNQRYGGYESDHDQPAANEPAIRKSTWRGSVPAAAAAWNYTDRSYR